uniref:UPF0711 protein C18orf21 homolog isoform X1 n=1 Tax=Geotrypetes seraphini TaxID=260995 RepID=A0A6P8PRL4_GEOSA|nr:UPF0711 protein C18orf21 homolog isoform X1 [Geotrypetes seraphini]
MAEINKRQLERDFLARAALELRERCAPECRYLLYTRSSFQTVKTTPERICSFCFQCLGPGSYTARLKPKMKATLQIQKLLKLEAKSHRLNLKQTKLLRKYKISRSVLNISSPAQIQDGREQLNFGSVHQKLGEIEFTFSFSLAERLFFMPKRRGRSAAGASRRSGNPPTITIEQMLNRLQRETTASGSRPLELATQSDVARGIPGLEVTLSPDARDTPPQPQRTSSPREPDLSGEIGSAIWEALSSVSLETDIPQDFLSLGRDTEALGTPEKREEKQDKQTTSLEVGYL